MNLVVGVEQLLRGRGVDAACAPVEFRRRDEAGARKILIARRARLAVPQLFVFNLGGGELGDAFKAQHDVAQIGDGGVAVLEVEALEKLGGIVRAHPLDGIANRIGRARVARQRIGDLFREAWARRPGRGEVSWRLNSVIITSSCESV